MPDNSQARIDVNKLAGLIFNALMNFSTKSNCQSSFGAWEEKLTVVSHQICWGSRRHNGEVRRLEKFMLFYDGKEANKKFNSKSTPWYGDLFTHSRWTSKLASFKIFQFPINLMTAFIFAVNHLSRFVSVTDIMSLCPKWIFHGSLQNKNLLCDEPTDNILLPLP